VNYSCKPFKTLMLTQFTLSSISTIIRLKNYQRLIINKNKYLASIATIPIEGITGDMLDLAIHVDHPSEANKHMTICKIFMSND